MGVSECATPREPPVVPLRVRACVRARPVLGVHPAGGAPGYFGVSGGGGPVTGEGARPTWLGVLLLRVRRETMEANLDGTTVRRRRRVRCESTGET